MELLSSKLHLETILRHRLPHLLPINIPDDLFTDLNVVDSPISFVPISPLKVLYTNADQFLNKWDDILMLITGNKPDLILINEVLPKAHSTCISSCRVDIPYIQIPLKPAVCSI